MFYLHEFFSQHNEYCQPNILHKIIFLGFQDLQLKPIPGTVLSFKENEHVWMPRFKLRKHTPERFYSSEMNINNDPSVFDFNEEDPKPSLSFGFRHLFEAAFNHKETSYGKQLKHGKHLGITSRKKRKTSMKKLMTSTSQGNVAVQEASGNCSSSASDMIEAVDSDSESNQDRMQLDMRFGGARGGPCLSACRDEDHITEMSRKVVIYGEELFFLEQVYSSPEFHFTGDAIVLKIQVNGARCVVTWPLHEIEEFRSYSGEKKGLELDVSEHGLETFRQQLGQSDSCEKYHSCYTLASSVSNSSSSWGEDIKQITSLSDGYRSIWRPGKEDMSVCRDMSEQFQRNACRQDLNNHGIQHLLVNCSAQDRNIASSDDWSDLIFPTKEDHDAVTVTKYDYLLLNPDQFLSDTIIDFYIKYLQCLLSEDAKKRFYFYNSFFFRKLTETDKNFQHGIEKSKASFERVRRWTARFNIFDKDFLFIPIMQSAHWSLVIVCHPGYLSADCQDACDSKAAMVLHFDSLDGCHTCVEEPIRNYLVEAWNERNGHNEDSASFSAVKFIAVKVPQQTNYSDCGLFLLHYVELFIKEVLEKDSIDFVTDEWFNPAEASGKRAEIQSLIKNLKAKESPGKLEKSQHHISDGSWLAQRSVSIGKECFDAVIKEETSFPGNLYEQACSMLVSHPQHHGTNLQVCSYTKLGHHHSELAHDHEQHSAVARELQLCFHHGQEQAPCGEFSMLSVLQQGAVNHVEDISVLNCTCSEDNWIACGQDRVALNVALDHGIGSVDLEEFHDQVGDKFSSDGILSERGCEKRSQSLDDCEHSTSDETDSLAEIAVKSNIKMNEGIHGSNADNSEPKDWLIDSVSDANDQLESRETVYMDVATQRNADDHCRVIDLESISPKGANSQQKNEARAASKFVESRFLENEDDSPESVIMEGGVSVSRELLTECKSPQTTSDNSSPLKEERAGLDRLHYISSDEGLTPIAAKSNGEGKRGRGRYRGNAQHHESENILVSVDRRVTRSASKKQM